VVGDGVTGLSCALTLADAGQRARLYEAAKTALGYRAAIRATETCSGSRAAISSRTAILGHREPELELFDPARLL
jgi:phytoene dehydrogenase-like protein